jgi:hypothetical protein
MADLKANSTIGGLPIWHQGSFPLFPINDTLLYKTYKVYTEYDKPKAVDNDFVSKADGGIYAKPVQFRQGLTFLDDKGATVTIGKATGTAGATYTASIKVPAQFAFETGEGKPFVIFDPVTDMTKPRLIVMGDILGKFLYDETGRVYSPGNKPTNVDVGLGNVSNDAQVKINTTTLQTMAGPLAAPNLSSLNAASAPQHVPRFDQIVVRDSIQDFGTY